ncbi:glycosyltransferase family 2 protein [Streptosporangium amethystogenes]|uniref:glycosyltransferase family 2 protein n=1 Tax=Streptosporangium amethystogenes TaxID=2002 RepID=UPI0014706080|nr:glycosyltransferase family 2 protein [Streptosporangium amethystogenes]
MEPRITVIIPSRDRYRDLRRCLKALAECNTALLYEVLVVDDGSKPRIADAVEVAGLPIRLLRNPQPIGAMPSRSFAAEQAVSPVIAFLDDDALPRADWLDQIDRELTTDRGGVTGRVLPFDSGVVSRARQSRYLDRYRGLRPGQEVRFFAGGNGAVWREAFLAARGDVVNEPGSDNDIVAGLAAMGLSVNFVPTMVIVHRNSKGLMRAVRDAYGAGRRHPERLTMTVAVQQVLGSASGRDVQTRLVNWALNVVHLAGRRGPRRLAVPSTREQ